MLNAYLWNIAFIVVLLILDKVATDVLFSKEFVITKRNFPIAMGMHLFSFISFKTSLYLFYAFVLKVNSRGLASDSGLMLPLMESV